MSDQEFSTIPNGFKKCYDCKSVKPLSEFTVNHGKRDGYSIRCRTCESLRRPHKPKPPTLPDGFKRCKRCGEIKMLSEFSHSGKSKDSHATYCRKCDSLRKGYKTRQPKPKTQYRSDIDAIEIPLTMGYVATIDVIDADLAEFHWQAWPIKNSNRVYARRAKVVKGEYREVLLHRTILSRVLNRPLDRQEQVDHRDLDGLNCRRSNLRLATNAQNTRNKKVRSDSSSGIKGVYARGLRWQAVIYVNEKSIHLGMFDTAEEAASAYREAAIKYFGEFARTE